MPKCSRSVSRSASAWHGWWSSVSALMTGTEAALGEPLDVGLRERADDDRRGSSATGRAPVSAIGSPRPSWSSSGRSMSGSIPEPLRRRPRTTRACASTASRSSTRRVGPRARRVQPRGSALHRARRGRAARRARCGVEVGDAQQTLACAVRWSRSSRSGKLVALDRAGHAARAAAAAAELGAGDRDDLDALRGAGACSCRRCARRRRRRRARRRARCCRRPTARARPRSGRRRSRQARSPATPSAARDRPRQRRRSRSARDAARPGAQAVASSAAATPG